MRWRLLPGGRSVPRPQGSSAPCFSTDVASYDVNDLARRNDGRMPELPPSPFTWAELMDSGVSRRRFRTLLADGTVVRLLRGVYAESGAPDSVEFRARAVGLVSHPRAVICDRTAAWIHGVDVLAYAEHEHLPPIDTCTLPGVRATRREECFGKQRDLRPSDWMTIGGLRVTTPLRTSLDLGCALARRDALAALDGFMRAHRIRRSDLAAELPRYFRRRGVVQLRQLIGIATPRAESPPESWARLAIIDAGLPAPEPQRWVEIDGVPTFRLDLAYYLLRIAIEYDGEEFHSAPDQRAHDAARRSLLEQQGWLVLVLDKDCFTDERVAAWTGQLRAALRDRRELARRQTMWHRSPYAPGQQFTA